MKTNLIKIKKIILNNNYVRINSLKKKAGQSDLVVAN